MRKFIAYTIGLIGTALLQTGCYEDKGNYDYHDVNAVTITIPETKVRMPKEQPVEVVITPEISQTLGTQESDLEFQWKKLKIGTDPRISFMDDYEDLSVGKKCILTVEPNRSENIGLLLVVKDKKNGTTWYQKGQVNIIKPLNPCWFVLQEGTEKGALGVVEGTPEGYYIFPDVFNSEAGKDFPLQGKPLSVYTRKNYGDSYAAQVLPFFGFTVKPGLVVVTDKDVSLFTPSTLTARYKSDQILYEFAAQGKSIGISRYKMDRHGEMFITPDKVYFSYMDGFCLPYTVKAAGQTDLPNITAFGSGASFSIFFDESAHRFMRLDALGMDDFMSGIPSRSSYIRMGWFPWQDNPITLKPVGQNTTLTNNFDPDGVDEALQVKDIVSGNNGNFLYAVAASTGSNTLTVFKFSGLRADPLCAARYSVTLPAEADLSAARFATSYAYTANLLFMASGNKLYRIDLDRNKVTEIYQYEDAAASIACIKFKEAESAEERGTTLGLGINLQEKGTVVELQLTQSGDVSREENSVCVYRDETQTFAKIVDIAFNYE